MFRSGNPQPSSPWNSYFQHHQDATEEPSSYLRRRIYGKCPTPINCFGDEHDEYDNDEEYVPEDTDEYVPSEGEEDSFVGEETNNHNKQQQQRRHRRNQKGQKYKKGEKKSKKYSHSDNDDEEEDDYYRMLRKQQRRQHQKIKLRHKLGLFLLFLYLASYFFIGDSYWINNIRQYFKNSVYGDYDAGASSSLDMTVQDGEITMHETIGVRRSRVRSSNTDTTTTTDADVLNVLTLGGPITWGINLSSRKYAYPYLLASPPSSTSSTTTRRSVTNVALKRAEKSVNYASQCLQTMIEEGNGGSTSIESHQQQNENDPSFDVIVLEFSLAGPSDYDLNFLLQRIRHRYPNAIIIYVHLWSLFMSVVDENTGLIPRDVQFSFPSVTTGGADEGQNGEENIEVNAETTLTREEQIKAMILNPDAHWVWEEPQMRSNHHALQIAQEAVQNVNGHLYEFRVPPSPMEAIEGGWFNDDNFHHLSAVGHEMVAQGVESIMQHAVAASSLTSPWRNDPQQQQQQSSFLLPRQEGEVGTWGNGDQCHSWYETGISKLTHTNGKMKRFVRYPSEKFAHHINMKQGGGTIEFINTSNLIMPVKLVFMSWGEDGVVYPKSRVTLVTPPPSLPEGGAVSEGESNSENPQAMVLNPMHPDPVMRQYHEPRSERVGYASPGKNVLEIVPLEETEKPLRVVGLMMCGVCD